jgi:hypothetical protein
MFKLTYLYILLGCLFFSSFSFAQEKKEEDAPNNKLQFYLINGLDIAYTDLSSDFPVRYAVSITGSIGKSSGDENRQSVYSNDTTQSKSNNDRKSFNYKVSSKFHYMVSLYNEAFFNTYFGVGPTFFFQRNYSNSVNQSERSNNPEISKSKTNYWSNYYGIGFSSIIGLESKLTDHVSLFAEYDLNYTYRWSDGRGNSKSNNSSSKNENNSTRYYLSLSYVKLGLSVYL